MSTVVEPGTLLYSPPRAPLSRVLGLALVLGLHAALIYALVTGLAFRSIEIARPPVITTIIAEQHPHETAPTPPPPRLAPPPPLFVPPPEVTIAKPPPLVRPKAPVAVTPVKPPPAPEVPVTRAAPVAAPPPVAAPAPAAPPEPVRVAPRLDGEHSREPEYPPASRRLGEQGSLLLEALIDTDGHVLETRLVQSSGSERLDRAALEGVKENYRFHPGTTDGKAQKQWFTIRFTWKLR